MGIFRRIVAAGSAVLGLCVCGSLHGAGFAIVEQSTVGLGRSLSGMGADIREPGSLYFNSATGAFFERDTVSAGSSFLHVDANIRLHHDNEAPGDDGGEGGGWNRIPHLYYVHRFGDGFAFGLGLSGTSGTSTSWSRHWAGRETALLTELAVINVMPSLSYRISDEWSIGAGLSIEQARVTMSMGLPGPFTHHGSQLKLKGESIDFGFTAGVLYRPWKSTRIGLGYRSMMKHDLELDGDMRFSGSDRALASGLLGRESNGHLKGDAECELKLPSSIDLSIQHDLNEAWTLSGTIGWTRSSVMDELKVKFDRRDALVQLAGREKTVDMSWRDNWRFALGADYRFNERLTLRFGTAYDQTPTSRPESRYGTLPDADRLWLSCGFSYDVTENCTLDFGYVHIFFMSSELENKTSAGTMRGSLDTKQCGCDIISGALTYRF